VHARPDLQLVLAYVAHGLRTPALDRGEADAVVGLAARLSARSSVLTVEVVRGGGGPESDARDARYAALDAEAERIGAVAVLVAHHADDQAETVLLRLARGTGVDGLAGMSPVAGHLIRPLLDVRRSDLHRVAELLLGESLALAKHDPMNDDEAVSRVRIRNEVMPSLGTIGPDPVGALTRLAALSRDDSAALDAITQGILDELPVADVGGVIIVPSAALRALPVGLARRVVRSLLSAATPRTAAAALPRRSAAAPSARTIERVLAAADGWRATLPGPLDVSVEQGWHVLAPTDAPPDVACELRPGRGSPADLVHAPSGLRITATDIGDGTDLIAVPSGVAPPGLDPGRFAVRLRLLGGFSVRTRRDGDRVRTSGGTRALADVMGEARIPRALRGRLPVVVCAEGTVRWVPGLVVDVTAQHDPARSSGEAGDSA